VGFLYIVWINQIVGVYNWARDAQLLPSSSYSVVVPLPSYS